MKIIYIESAYSYGGSTKTRGAEGVYDSYIRAFNVTKAYTVVEREVVQRRNPACTLLPGYRYAENQSLSVKPLKLDAKGRNAAEVKEREDLIKAMTESPENGCVKNGLTKANALLACLGHIAEKDELGNVYITNADNAHHFSYPLTKMAFEASNKRDKENNKKMKVVVNIDNHRDYGIFQADPTGGNDISCGSWGSYHVAYWALHGEGGAEYVTLSNGVETTQAAVYSCSKGGRVVTTTLDDAGALAHMRSYTKDHHEIYFTVDRDFMKENGTSYNTDNLKCIRDNAQGNDFMKEVMDLLAEKSTIIQADIIGLPTHGNIAGWGIEPPLPKAYAEALEDVKHFLRSIAPHLRR